MDKNTFFREATLKICGNLDIEKALYDLLQFLKDTMPVTNLFLEVYDSSYNSMLSIAHADLEGFKKLNLLTPLSKESKKIANNLPDNDIWLMKNSDECSITRDMYKLYNIETSSIIVLILRSQGKNLGTLILATTGNQRFSENHVKLVLLLKEPLIIAMSNTLRHREVLQLKNLIADDNKYLHSELRRIYGDEIIGFNHGLKDVMEKVRRVSSLDSPVLLLGETGVGKDVIANAIHYSSSRSKGPFVSVNCGAIPDTLIETVSCLAMKKEPLQEHLHEKEDDLKEQTMELFSLMKLENFHYWPR